MDWNEYCTEARKFAVYPADIGLFYVLLKLNGEIAEVSALDGNRRADSAILKELGDVCWYIAAAQHELKIKKLPETPMFDGVPYESELLSLFEWTADLQQMVAKAYRDEGGKIIKENKVKAAYVLSHLLGCINRLSVRHDSTFEDALAANITKLTARQAAGMIRGSGEGEERR